MIEPVLTWADIVRQVSPGGTMLELGVFEGDSFTIICDLVKPRKVYGFDWFRGLPEDWGPPGSAGRGDRNGIAPECPRNGEFIVGLVAETLPPFVAGHPPAAFVHFDLDLYSSTAAALSCLEFQSGAVLVFDEIDGCHRNIMGEQRAFHEWLNRTGHDFELLGSRHGESWVIRLLTAQV